MNKRDIEIVVAEHFNYRMNIIVPNVSWGLFSYFPSMEIDLLILRPSGWGEEVEIKTTAADIAMDLRKKRYRLERYGFGWRNDQLLRRRYFAIPKKLVGNLRIPADVGILSVDEEKRFRVEKAAPINKNARRFTDEERLKLLHLGCMRIWSLKAHLNKKAVAEEGK